MHLRKINRIISSRELTDILPFLVYINYKPPPHSRPPVISTHFSKCPAEVHTSLYTPTYTPPHSKTTNCRKMGQIAWPSQRLLQKQLACDWDVKITNTTSTRYTTSQHITTPLSHFPFTSACKISQQTFCRHREGRAERPSGSRPGILSRWCRGDIVSLPKRKLLVFCVLSLPHRISP